MTADSETVVEVGGGVAIVCWVGLGERGGRRGVCGVVWSCGGGMWGDGAGNGRIGGCSMVCLWKRLRWGAEHWTKYF